MTRLLEGKDTTSTLSIKMHPLQVLTIVDNYRNQKKSQLKKEKLHKQNNESHT